MREYTAPLDTKIPTSGSLVDDVLTNGHDHPQTVVFSRRTPDGWVDVNAGEFLTQVRAVSKGFLAAGIEAGDRVGLLSKTRYEWTLLDYAIWYAGAVTVPIYETSSTEQIAWILSDSGARGVVVESADHQARLAEVRADLDELALVWSIDDRAVEVLTALGADIADAELEARRAALTPESLATLIYTSGTTARPKGCELSHGNFMYELSVSLDEMHRLFDVEGASTLLFLPLAHVFARIIQVGAIKARVRLGHSSDIKNLLGDLEAFQPTFILAVPRVFEKVFNTASHRATADGRGRIFERAAEVAISFSRAQDAGRPRAVLRAKHALFDRLVYKRLRVALGGRCEYAVSGGAPLGERLGHFYRGIGVTVLEGYGLTETTAAVTANLPDALKIGTVGRPIGGTSVRVADDGELLVMGDQVMRGYWRNPTATQEVLDADGWFHTGDLGELDDEGFVRITGRKKEILVTAGGKNVAPAALEDRLRAHPLVDQCIVVGDGKPFIAALVTIDTETLPAWAQAHGKPADAAALVEDPDLRATLQTAVDDANKAVSRAEAIRRFAILPTIWSEEGGQLTPSLKLKRNVVMREARADVERLYQN